MNEIGVAIVEIVKINVQRLLYANETFLFARACSFEEIQDTYDGNIVELLDAESKIKMSIIMEEALRYKLGNINFDVKVNCRDGEYKNLLCKGKLVYENERVTMNLIETDITGVSENLAAGIL